MKKSIIKQSKNESIISQKKSVTFKNENKGHSNPQSFEKREYSKT